MQNRVTPKIEFNLYPVFMQNSSSMRVLIRVVHKKLDNLILNKLTMKVYDIFNGLFIKCVSRNKCIGAVFVV